MILLTYNDIHHILEIRANALDVWKEAIRRFIFVVVSSSHQSQSLGVSLFRTAPSIMIPLLVWSASKGSQKVVGVMRRMTTVLAMVACCWVDSIYVLTKDMPVTGVQLCQNSSCHPWQCQFGCGNLATAAYNGSSGRILVDAADCRLVAGVAEWLLVEVLLDVRPKSAD